MLENLSEQVRECLRHADECAHGAKSAKDPQLRQDLLQMEGRWLSLARSYLFSESLSFSAHMKEKTAEGLLKVEEFSRKLAERMKPQR
jgi:hypothetical protein